MDVAVKQFGRISPYIVFKAVLPIQRKAKIAETVRGRNVIYRGLTVLCFAFKEVPTVVDMSRKRQSSKIGIGTRAPVESRRMMPVIVTEIEASVQSAHEIQRKFALEKIVARIVVNVKEVDRWLIGACEQEIC